MKKGWRHLRMQEGCMQFSKAHGAPWLLPLPLPLIPQLKLAWCRGLTGPVLQELCMSISLWPRWNCIWDGQERWSHSLSLICSLGNSGSGFHACPVRKMSGKLPEWLETHRLTPWASKSCCRPELTAAFHGESKLPSHLHGWCEAKAFCLLM